MDGSRLVPTRYLAAAAIYSVVFPLTNLAGGDFMLVGILLTLPFLPLAWVGGLAVVWLFGSESFYLLGAALTVFLQVVALVAAFFFLRRDKHASAGA